MDIPSSLKAVAQPIVVKKEKPEAHLEGRNGSDVRPNANKENVESAVRSPGITASINDSSPNTQAAEAAAIAGMTALTQRISEQPDGVSSVSEAPEPIGTPSDERLRMEEESAAGALMSLTGSCDKKKRARALDFESPRARSRQKQSNAPRQLFMPGAPSHPGDSGSGGRKHRAQPEAVAGGGGAEAGPLTPGKRKACNCRNSKCLKLYCECFAAAVHCDPACNCHACHNNPQFDQERKAAIAATLERNPMAFRPKIGAAGGAGEEELGGAGRHVKGCHCKKSGCLKKYCECFQAGVMCSEQCKCVECRNVSATAASRPWLQPPPFASSSAAVVAKHAAAGPRPAQGFGPRAVSKTPSPVSSRKRPGQPPTPPMNKTAPRLAQAGLVSLHLPRQVAPSPPGVRLLAPSDAHCSLHQLQAPPIAVLQAPAAGKHAASAEDDASGPSSSGGSVAGLAVIAEHAEGKALTREESSCSTQTAASQRSVSSGVSSPAGCGVEGGGLALQAALSDSVLRVLGHTMRLAGAAAGAGAECAVGARTAVERSEARDDAGVADVQREAPEGAREASEGEEQPGAGRGEGGAEAAAERAMLVEVAHVLRRLTDNVLARPGGTAPSHDGVPPPLECAARGDGVWGQTEELQSRGSQRSGSGDDLSDGGADQPTAGPAPGEGDAVAMVC